MMTPYKISRVIFNFTNKCNLPCQFCYIPFDGKHSDLSLWKEIINRCKGWQPKLIVFGGGDPFIYQDFRALLSYCKDENTFIHVDTNALALRSQDIPLIQDAVNQIGLPLDGTETSHTLMRSNPKHFAVVIKWLKILLQAGVRVKVNTVVSKVNYESLRDLAFLLEDYPISQWCLYQFWPLAIGKENQEVFALSDQEYRSITAPIKEEFKFTNIDIASVEKRLHSHFFVSQTGNVYSESHNKSDEYVSVGTIFDDDIIEKWQKHGDPQAMSIRTKLRIEATGEL
jgi:MoaA/NifB/PqqE/SkfB family radical SAM enzyme